MSELEPIAAHRINRNEEEQSVLDRLGTIVFKVYHCLHCDETTEECADRFKCDQTRQHLDHISNCQNVDDCHDECYVYRRVLKHMERCRHFRCDLCRFRFDEHPLEYDDTYDEEEHETGGEDETHQQN